MPASLYTQAAVKIQATGRPSQRWMYGEQTRPAPDPLGPPWRRAPQGTSAPRPMGAYQRAAGYVLQANRTDPYRSAKAAARASAAEGMLRAHTPDRVRATLAMLGFTPRQIKRLMRGRYVMQGATPSFTIVDEVTDGTV